MMLSHNLIGDISIPKVSVIMPVMNEAGFIQRSIGSILNQDYPPEKLEIFIADGMSTDRTRELLEDFQSRHQNIHIIDNPNRIVPTGLNRILVKTSGEIIVRVDGHCEIASDYLSECVNALQRKRAENVGGKMSATGENAFGKAVACATSSRFGIGGGRFHFSDQEQWVDTVYLGAWPAEIFHHIGLFDEELVRNQDDEFNYRIRSHGGKVLLCPSIKSHYFVRSSFRALWKQYFQYGYWKVRVLQKHPRQMQIRQFVPPIFVATIIFLSLFSAFSIFGRFGFLLVAGIYILVNLIVSIITTFRKGNWWNLALLPVVFSCLHLSYGTGFLIGLFHFWNRWGDKEGLVPTWEDTEIRINHAS